MSIIDKFLHNPSKNWRNYWTGMAAYIVLGIPALYLARNYFAESSLRYVLVMLPIIPAMWAGYSLVQYILEQDELVKKTHMEATLIASVFICGFLFTYHFLEGVGLPRLPAYPILLVFAAVWSIAYFFTKHKYGIPMINKESQQTI